MSTQKRLLWIRKSFGDEVWARTTVLVFSPGLVHRLMASSQFQGDTVLELAEALAPTLQGHSPFDRHLRWGALQIHRALKKEDYHTLGLLRLHWSKAIDWAEAHPRIDMLPMSLQQVMLAHTQWHEELAAKALGEPALTGKILHRWPTGYTLQLLETKAQLDAEGAAMGHCVGTHWNRVQGGWAQVWSLRSPKGLSRLTVELALRGGKVNQVTEALGAANEIPKEKYGLYLIDYLKMIGMPQQQWGQARIAIPAQEIAEQWMRDGSIVDVGFSLDEIPQERPQGLALEAIQLFGYILYADDNGPEAIEDEREPGQAILRFTFDDHDLSELMRPDRFMEILCHLDLDKDYLAIVHKLGVDLEHAGSRGDLQDALAVQIITGADPTEPDDYQEWHEAGLYITTMNTMDEDFGVKLEATATLSFPTFVTASQWKDDMEAVSDEICTMRLQLMEALGAYVGKSSLRPEELSPRTLNAIRDGMAAAKTWTKLP